MSEGVLIAREHEVLRTAEEPFIGTLRATKRKSKRLVYRVTKRSFDIASGFVGCLFILPLAVFIKLAYLLTGDFGSIFFVQKRIGKNGQEFNFYKFRTMIKDADEKLADILKEEPYKSEWKKYQKLRNDPRISKAGKILRKTSLDEFPQFLTVLKGDMSLIGNRPYLPREKSDIPSYTYDALILTKPGMTGYWQVSGRSNLDFDERLRLESYYSNHASLSLDSAILFKTPLAVLSHSGAD